MSNICFCIPARYQSTRLSHKLLLKFNNYSCIQKTINQVIRSRYFDNNIYILTDNNKIKDELIVYPCNIILTSNDYKNGTERISKNLNKILVKYEYIVNIQADEPFISPINIDYCIEKHLEYNDDNIFYTTLHEINNSEDYLKSTASLKIVINNSNDVLYYSRNIIPWNKDNELKKKYIYKIFTGIYVFNRNKLKLYCTMQNTELQLQEDCEQLKILEYGYKIKSYSTKEYNEIS